MIIYIFNILSIPVYAKFIKNRKVFILVASFQLFLILALRDVTVGMDLENYSGGYSYIHSMSFVEMLKSLRLISAAKLVYPYSYESGYVVLNWIISHLGLTFHGFLVLHAAFCTGVFARFVNRFSKIPWISYVIFIGLGMYTYRFGILRQSLAVSLVLLSFDMLAKKKLWPFLALVLVAFTFHRSSLVIIPLYFARNIKVNRFVIKCLLVMQVIVAIASPLLFSTVIVWILQLLGKNHYTEMKFQFSELLLAFVVLEIMIFFFADMHKLNSTVGRITFWGFIGSIFILILAQCNSAFGRLQEYYMILLPAFIPQLLSASKYPKYNRYIIILIVVAMTAYMVLTIRGTLLVPWKMY